MDVHVLGEIHDFNTDTGELDHVYDNKIIKRAMLLKTPNSKIDHYDIHCVIIDHVGDNVDINCHKLY